MLREVCGALHNEGGLGQCGDFFACGVLYRLSRSGNGWTETSYPFDPFNGSIGVLPYAGVIQGHTGNLYGTTTETNASVYQMTPDGQWSALHTFSPEEEVYAGLISDASGNLYGATASGGSGNGGEVFELSPSGGGWAFNVLYSFTYSGQLNVPGSWASLTFDNAGNLYGTTRAEGASGCGTVFKLSPSNGGWSYSTLHNFACGDDGGTPLGSVATDSAGNLWGTASADGSHNQGVIWEITP
jgi:uncharacterized repeat protein (TIGR03803 family)